MVVPVIFQRYNTAMNEHMIVTIDGPAGSGKSTVAALLAKKLSIAYLDTGAMYRAIGYYLNKLSLSLENVKKENLIKIKDVKSNLSQAIQITKKIENFILAVDKQMSEQKSNISFSLANEINQCNKLLAYKARKTGVTIDFSYQKNIKIYGDAIKFNQLITNLISNAIDAYKDIPKDKKKRRIVLLTLNKKKNKIHICIRDFGSGIKSTDLNKIGDPFLNIKDFKKDITINLSSSRHIVENSFKGEISIKSKINKGTTFHIYFTLTHKNKKNKKTILAYWD